MEERNIASNTELHFSPSHLSPDKLVFIFGCSCTDTICNELSNIGGNTIYWFAGSYKIICDEYTKFAKSYTHRKCSSL